MIEDYGLKYPLDAYEIARHLGMNLHVILPDSALHRVLYAHSEALTIAVHSPKASHFETFIDGLATSTRQRFSIVHELAHVWLGHTDIRASCECEQAEGEANFFAQYVLAPDSLVTAWLPEPSAECIRDFFNVSHQTAAFVQARVLRAQRSGVLQQEYDRRILEVARASTNDDSAFLGDAA
ncbi:MAG: ImmA/IrrE family metallo-endopeptidase [Actinomycetales bacterium]|nr:ImmA/IrrE family metallo-endopeptidase [Actinomycetales bacterium]